MVKLPRDLKYALALIMFAFRVNKIATNIRKKVMYNKRKNKENKKNIHGKEIPLRNMKKIKSMRTIREGRELMTCYIDIHDSYFIEEGVKMGH